MRFLSKSTPTTTNPQIYSSINQPTLFFGISSENYHMRLTSLHNSPEPTATTANSADVTDLAHCAAVLGQVLGAIEGAGNGGLAAGVDGSVAGAADGEFGEGVVFDVDGVCGLALGDGFEFAGLREQLD